MPFLRFDHILAVKSVSDWGR